MKKYNLEKITAAKSICLIAHIDPDVDAICSMVVFKKFLMDTFNKNKIDIFAECDSLPKDYLPLLDGCKFNPKPGKYDCAIIMDCPNRDRIGIYQPLYNNAKIKGVIDHHATNDLHPDLRIVEIVSSTCEILYSIFKKYKYTLNAKICSRLYAGLITDTNNFSVGAITKRSFELASACIKHINPVNIYDYFFLNISLKSRILFAKAINNINSYENGKILISHISKIESKKLNLVDSDYTGISNQIAGTEGNKIICFIHPKGNNYYVSMRAKPPYSVAEIAKKHGGGGHVGAAAYLSSAKPEIIEQEILKELTKELHSKKEGSESNLF